MLPLLLFGGLLTATGLLLAWWQHTSWQAETRDGPEEPEFLRGQYRRRMAMAALVAATGIAIAAGRLVTDPLWAGIYWLGVILVVLLVLVLAIVDFLAGRERYLAASDDLKVEQARLRQQVRELRTRAERNGHD